MNLFIDGCKDPEKLVNNWFDEMHDMKLLIGTLPNVTVVAKEEKDKAVAEQMNAILKHFIDETDSDN